MFKNASRRAMLEKRLVKEIESNVSLTMQHTACYKEIYFVYRAAAS